MTCGIYCYWDNKKDCLAYIGQSIHMGKRHKEHLEPSRYNDQPFNRILQNSPHRYEFIILLECKKDELTYQEDLAIMLYNPRFNYKLDSGHYQSGDQHPYFGKKRPEHSKRMSGKNHPFYGKNHTKEAKNKISKANSGKKMTLENRINISKSHNTSGFLNVHKKKDSTTKQGFLWCYRYIQNGKRISISSVNIHNLKNKVIKRGFPWKKI